MPQLSVNRADWTEPVRIPHTDDPGTPAWMARGTYGPAMLITDDGDPLIFVTGTRGAPRWPVFNLKRLLRARKPVVPSPFYLATGSLRLPGVIASTNLAE